MFSPELLIHNQYNYPELFQPYDSDKISYATTQLLKLPLFHASNTRKGHLLPSSMLPEDKRNKHSHTLDMSLGLDNYVYFTWGIPDWSQYGQCMHEIDPQILLSPKTIVTPWDIAPSAERNLEIPYNELPLKLQQKICNEYFGFILSGSDWLNLMARRVINRIQSGSPLIMISTGGVGMGEIKFEGKIPNEWIWGCCHNRQELEQYYYPYMYKIGFGFEGSEIVRHQKTQFGYSPMTDPTPEDLGIDYKNCTSVWDAIRY